jgi:hypothetical protein
MFINTLSEVLTAAKVWIYFEMQNFSKHFLYRYFVASYVLDSFAGNCL